jgi:hypothetical protein
VGHTVASERGSRNGISEARLATLAYSSIDALRSLPACCQLEHGHAEQSVRTRPLRPSQGSRMSFQGPTPSAALAVAPFRLLVISNETVEGDLLHDAIMGMAGERSASVIVVAPALNSRIRHWCSDEDPAREAAQHRLDRALARLRERGINARGSIGDADPLRAIEDALRIDAADELLIATHPEERSNWLAHNLVERALLQFGLPTAHIVVDLHPRESVRGRALATA